MINIKDVLHFIKTKDRDKFDDIYYRSDWHNLIQWDDNLNDISEKLFIDELLYEANIKNNDYAQVFLAFLYENGSFGLEKDYSKALELRIRSDSLGNPHAPNTIGWIYFHGLGVEINFVDAFKWFEKGAAKGDLNSSNMVGLMYLCGYGVEQNNKKAAEWFKKGLARNHYGSIHNIGWLYLNGYGVEKNKLKALKLFTKSANQNCKISNTMISTKFTELEVYLFRKLTKLKTKLKKQKRLIMEYELRPPSEGGELFFKAMQRFEEETNHNKKA
jgi:TPR repeat protein